MARSGACPTHAVPGSLRVGGEQPDRNLALELVRVTEAAAMAAGRWVGRGDKNGADQAAVNAMRQLVSTVSMNGVVVIGEGEKDEAPMLYNGEEVGDGIGPDCDVAVDPVDGTTLTAKGMTNAISVMAVADRGAMYDPSAVFYMDKLVTGPAAADVVDIEAPVEHNIQAVAKAKGCSAEDVTVVVLDRPRHEQLVAEIREAGARIEFIADGDVAGRHHGRARGHRHRPAARHRRHPRGDHRGLRREVPRRRDPRQAVAARRRRSGRRRSTPATTSTGCCAPTTWSRGDNVFFVATGVTDGELLDGVRYRAGGASTHSLVMRSKSGTIRSIHSDHRLTKLRAYSAIDFDHHT